MGIQFSDWMGFTLPPLATLAPPVYHQVPLLILCGSIGSGAFALACGASWIEVTVSGLTAACRYALLLLRSHSFRRERRRSLRHPPRRWAWLGGLLSRRYMMPPLITMIVGYTPMLPGLTLYRGMYASLNEQMISGFTNLSRALAIAGALAAGVVLGERVARRLRRPQYFRPYATIKRVGHFSFHQASRLAARKPRIPRVPLSPSPPRSTAPSCLRSWGPSRRCLPSRYACSKTKPSARTEGRMGVHHRDVAGYHAVGGPTARRWERTTRCRRRRRCGRNRPRCQIVSKSSAVSSGGCIT